MRIHIATDHAGLELSHYLIEQLRGQGHEVFDHGPKEYDALDDYPGFCINAALAVVRDEQAQIGALGIVLGGSGNGEQIAANKVQGIRAALVWNESTAKLAREHNNANVVAVGARQHSREEVLKLVELFIAEPFSFDERHARRIGKIANFEQTGEVSELPEGPSVHRSANDFNRNFAGQKVVVDSPQGRFSIEAKKISNRTLQRARAIGKQLLLEFDNGLTLRIHLGIYGKWRAHPPGKLPDVTGEVRARFSSAKAIFELRGPTICEVIDEDEVATIEKRLGPDPLNTDARGREKARFVEKVAASKLAIGQLLMNQDVIAGIGNVYRAEILFRAKIEPHTPGNRLTKEQVEAIWDDSVKLMKVGVKTSFMITRDELFTKRPSKADRNWVYKREGQPCRICATNVSLEIMAARKLYWCASCQR